MVHSYMYPLSKTICCLLCLDFQASLAAFLIRLFICFKASLLRITYSFNVFLVCARYSRCVYSQPMFGHNCEAADCENDVLINPPFAMLCVSNNEKNRLQRAYDEFLFALRGNYQSQLENETRRINNGPFNCLIRLVGYVFLR